MLPQPAVVTATTTTVPIADLKPADARKPCCVDVGIEAWPMTADASTQTYTPLSAIIDFYQTALADVKQKAACFGRVREDTIPT